MKVITTNQYEKLGIPDKELNRIPIAGEIIEVTEERFNKLNGNNQFNAIFVKSLKSLEEEKNIKYCFGSVCWGGYLERYINIFAQNYIKLYRSLIYQEISYDKIANPIVVYNEDTPDIASQFAINIIKKETGKDLILIEDKHKYNNRNIMYSTRNTLRKEFKNTYPGEKVYFYFPMDDRLKSDEISKELIKLAKSKVLSACLFKFLVKEDNKEYIAQTIPINSYLDIKPDSWGGYCAYKIIDDDKCPLYPKMPIPNVAFYVELYKKGYIEYSSNKVCIEHLRHKDSHHFKYKDDEITKETKEYLLKQQKELRLKEERRNNI